jgi:plasmid stabilization system protein ParE
MNAPRRHPLAQSDIEHAARYYEAQKLGLGADFVEEVQRTISLVASQPLRYSIRFGAWRRANLRRFPYAIFYQVIEDAPVVFAVLHGRSDFKPMLQRREA